jgi:hypothetical protein
MPTRVASIEPMSSGRLVAQGWAWTGMGRLLASLMVVAPATIVQAQVQPQAVCTTGLHKNWGFAAGTPLNEPPARSLSSGQITVATQGGYLHALSWEGAFLWSYSTEGGLLSGVHAVGDGRLVAISSSRQVYAWHSHGQLQWSFRSPVTPSEVVVSDPRGLVFFVSGTRLYALTARGTLSWSAELDGPVASNVAIDALGSAWLVTQDGQLHRVRTPYFHDTWALDETRSTSPVEGAGEGPKQSSAAAPKLVMALPEGAVILRHGELSYVNSDGKVRWRHNGIAHAVAPHSVDSKQNAQVVALDQTARAAWISVETGEASSRIQLGSLEPVSDDLALSASGPYLAIGDTGGTVWVYNQRGQGAHCSVSFASVLAPLFDRDHRQIIAAAGDGSVSAFGFDGEW